MTERGRVVAVGHVGLNVRDLEALARFYRETVGLKQAVYIPSTVAIFEVGDVDVFLAPGEPGAADFDLSVDDVDAFRSRLVSAKVVCTEPADSKVTGHRGFTFTDPDGNRVNVTSAHPRAR
jgi:catechol 2,3-dioxygenase-like lactoylglutathione lyase family enzyme